ncbi:MAG: type II secretion system protein GspE, partial [Casimicrobiaceae bacterium]
MDTPVRKRLGEILIERGKLDAATLERALRLQQESGEKLGALLVTLGVVAQRDVAEALAVQLGLPLVDVASYPEFPILEERVSARFLRDAHALPVREDDNEVTLAMADPTDAYTIGAFEMVTGR